MRIPRRRAFWPSGLERLHAFFVRQLGAGPPEHREVRVIYFASPQEYGQYRARPGADAFFVGVDSRDYIVLPAMPRGELRVAAHEYAHVLIHSGGWTLPEWIAEGIGDVVSTLRIGERDTRIGGDLPDRIQTLQRGTWMTFPELFAFTLKGPAARADRENMFYAQSWALTDLLMLVACLSRGISRAAGRPGFRRAGGTRPVRGVSHAAGRHRARPPRPRLAKHRFRSSCPRSQRKRPKCA